MPPLRERMKNKFIVVDFSATGCPVSRNKLDEFRHQISLRLITARAHAESGFPIAQGNLKRYEAAARRWGKL